VCKWLHIRRCTKPCEHNPTYPTYLTSPESAFPASTAKHPGAAITFDKHAALAP
jgi:hypothetical protein